MSADTEAEKDTIAKEGDEPAVELPELIDLNEFQRRPLAEMHQLAADIGLRVAGVRSKHQLVF